MQLDPRLLELARKKWWAFLLTLSLGILAGVLAIAQASALASAVNQVFLERKTLAETTGTILLLLVVLIVRPLLSLGSDLSAHATARLIKSDLRSRLLNQIEKLGPTYTQNEKTGSLTNILVDGVEALDAYFSQYLPGLALALLVPLSILIYVFSIDLLSGVVLLVTGPLIPFFLSLIGTMAQELTQRQWRTLNRLSAYFLDVIQGLTTLKMFGRSRQQADQIAIASEQFRKATMDILRVTFLSALTLEMCATISTAVVAVEIGLRLLYGRMEFWQAFVILILAPEFYQPLRMLGARFHSGMAGVEAARQIFGILETSSNQTADIREKTGEVFKNDNTAFFIKGINFLNVSVEFKAGRPALRGISFEMLQGQKVALVGPSGGGKSTVASLLLRFIEPEDGQILVDGHPLADIPADVWRKGLAWVSQNPYLLNDTVEANIRLGCPGASREAVILAARQAEADDFIRNLPDGYETQIGERGARLSGGQAQRIALARAFLKNAELIILDEATANLDVETEAFLQTGLQRLLKGRTCLVIAHRLKTVRDADLIVVLDRGQICQSGTHPQLTQLEGLYRQLIMTGNGVSIMEPQEITQSAKVRSQASLDQNHTAKRRSEAELLAYGFVKKDRLPVIGRLIRLVSSIWRWVALSTISGAATILSGVGLMATSAYIISAAALHPSVAVLAVPIVGVRFFGIVRGVFRYLERYLSHQATFRLLARLRVWFYQALEPLAPARLMRYQSGDLLTRMLGDIQSLENLYVRGLAPPLAAFFALIAVSFYFFDFQASFVWVLVCFWLAAGVLVPIVAYKMGKSAGKRIITERAALNASMVDFIQGLPDLQAFGQSKPTVDQINRRGDGLLRSQEQMAVLNSLQSMVVTQVSGLGMWTILVLAIPFVTLGQLDGVYLAVLALAALTSFEAVAPLPVAAQHLENNLQAARRLFEVVDTEPDVIDPLEPLELPDRFDLQVNELSFGYPGGENVLQDVSFDLPQGKHIGVVGPSGSGKSTLVNLLLRFWDVYPGQILLGSKDLRLYDQEQIRMRIGVVPQQVFLFNLSLRENLLLRDCFNSDEEEITRVVEIAQIQGFIHDLPEGLDSWVGEQGVRISGGERQRIAIARALLQLNARGQNGLLVLDEGTAHLDAQMECEVLRSILKHTRGRSLLMISHNLVGMQDMDEILVMDHGRVVERGTHAELLAANGTYSRMWGIQNNLILDE